MLICTKNGASLPFAEWLSGQRIIARKHKVSTRMDYLAAISAFVRSVDLGSFSRAAAEAGVKVSTVSRYVSGLEADLGAALLNRSTRNLHLTEAGRMFYERATQILADVEDARSATRSLNSRPQGLLRLNVPGAFGRRHVMPHMKDFLSAHPDIRLDATLTDATVDLIETGTDVAVRIGALVDSSLVAKRLAPQRRVLVASREYLAAAPPLQMPGDIIHHECLPFALQPTGAWYYRPADQPGVDPVEVAVNGHLRANDSEALRDAALAGLGIALLPTWLVGDDVRERRLVAVLRDWEWLLASGPERAIWAVYPPKKVVSPKVKAFLAFIVPRFGHPAYWDRP
jgi:DNA-binding transcriptional LysR family regulator